MDTTENSLLSAAQKLDLNSRCRRCNWAKRSHTKIGVRLVCPDSSGTFAPVVSPSPAVEVADLGSLGPDLNAKGHKFWIGLGFGLVFTALLWGGLAYVTFEVFWSRFGAY